MKRPHKRKQALVLLLSVSLLVTLWLLPGRPPEAALASGNAAAGDLISEAMSVIENGTDPMKGVSMLKEVLEEDPGNRQALMALGYYSLKSGQYEKAVGRFAEIVRIHPEDAEAWYFLAEAHALNGEAKSAIDAFDKFTGISGDSQATSQARKRIEELQQTLMN